MIGLGPTATAAFGWVYAQNHYDLNKYYSDVNNGRFPIDRGYELTQDDVIRRHHIFDFLCRQEAYVMSGWRDEVETLVKKGWVTTELTQYHMRVKVKPEARAFLRHICKVFDNKDIELEHLKIAQKTITRKVA
jgi:oxygen-independent coproporphyrinogen-3 oxidase